METCLLTTFSFHSLPSELHRSFLNYSPANAEAASLYRDNMKEYVRRVKATVEESWVDEGPSGSSSHPSS